jgi:hypothetical protein
MRDLPEVGGPIPLVPIQSHTRPGGFVKLPHITITRRAGTVAAAAVLVIGFASWAFADGELPLISSTSDPTTSSTVAPAAAGATSSPGASTDNAAVASNTVDGRTVYAISLKIVQTDASTIDATNAAVAAASCND